MKKFQFFTKVHVSASRAVDVLVISQSQRSQNSTALHSNLHYTAIRFQCNQTADDNLDLSYEIITAKDVENHVE